MSMEQGLYAQVVMLRRNYLKITEANKNKNGFKFKFQGQSVRSQSLFNIDFDWIKENYSTSGPDFYRNIFQKNDKTQDTNTFEMFKVPIGNSKCVKKIKFHSKAPMIKYHQESLDSFCFSSLTSDFTIINQTRASNDIAMCIEE